MRSSLQHLEGETCGCTSIVLTLFDKHSPPFVLQTDASAVGVAAVLEQGGHVIGYASRALNTTEQQYSVTQKECLAIVFAMKQVRHHLL